RSARAWQSVSRQGWCVMDELNDRQDGQTKGRVSAKRWLRATEVTDGTKAKIKRVMSAVFSHAVRSDFCGHNPISSGIPVGSGGKRGPSTGVRVSAKRQKSPLVLSPEEVKLGLAQSEFRDQLLVFLDGALGIRQGELGALRWLDCYFEKM